jgi:DNA-binding transcriptional regulator WhiA
MDKFEIMMVEPTGNRRKFVYDVRTKQDADEVLEMIKESLKPGFEIESSRYSVNKDK